MTTLITGGAGYIGSVTAARLRESDEDVVILDDLGRGRAEQPVAAPRVVLPPATQDRFVQRRLLLH